LLLPEIYSIGVRAKLTGFIGRRSSQLQAQSKRTAQPRQWIFTHVRLHETKSLCCLFTLAYVALQPGDIRRGALLKYLKDSLPSFVSAFIDASFLSSFRFLLSNCIFLPYLLQLKLTENLRSDGSVPSWTSLGDDAKRTYAMSVIDYFPKILDDMTEESAVDGILKGTIHAS
jgi:hypothetical protein